jgi:hypothetical protein
MIGRASAFGGTRRMVAFGCTTLLAHAVSSTRSRAERKAAHLRGAGGAISQRDRGETNLNTIFEYARHIV